MQKLKEVDYKLLSELMRNSKTTDRALAKKIGVSQPTVTRRRARLEKRGMLEYTSIPNFKQLGFEIMAFSFSRWTPDAMGKIVDKEEFSKEIQKFLSNHPNVIFGTTEGEGLGGMNSACISVHKNFADYAKWAKEIKDYWGEYVSDFNSFIFSLYSTNVVRQITFKHFADCLVANK
ncbi:MAG: winged helix-turn-helix transcriptional regulator [Candidatus Bathyarchaeota archaeon]|nr:winged helix-turn-helix transcriptional regulator [Candidatus Bathyarchaeota archaeon]